MVEPVTLGLGALAAYLGKDGLEKLLGPTAEYLGDGLRDLTQKRMQKVGEIFTIAAKKSGENIDDGGVVPPKLLRHIINDGSFADTDVETEYLGGILCSSRSSIERDNRSIRFAKILDGMSNYQILCHYHIYYSIMTIFKHSGCSANYEERSSLGIFIPTESFIESMSLSESELSNLEALLSHIFFGLCDDGLIEDQFLYGPEMSMKKHFANAEGPGIICRPSVTGIQLFLWAFGHGSYPTDAIFNLDFNAEIQGQKGGFEHAKPIVPAMLSRKFVTTRMD